MKRMFIFVLALTLFAGQVTAQSKKEKQVAAATEQLRKAMVDADKAMLEDFVTIDLTEQTISISGKTAMVRHTLTAKTNDNNKPGDVQLKVLLVWQKKGGHWKLLARQAVKLVH